jgi:hypothetical protein
LKRGASGAATRSVNDDYKKKRTGTADDDNSRASKNRTTPEHRSFCGTTITTASGSVGFDSSPSEGMIGILTQTLAFMNDESMENERQKNAVLKIRRVRDKIDAVTRKHDHLSRQISRSENGGMNTMRNQQIEKLTAYETELDDLELQLDALLDAESKRREKVICHRETAHCRAGQQAELKQMTTQDDGSRPWSSSSSSSSVAAIIEGTTEDKKCASNIGGNPMITAIGGSVVMCFECSIMPTKHKCQKCKERFVCDVCCSTKRGLELVWWCETCFARETPAAQALIRSGNYDSDSGRDEG